MKPTGPGDELCPVSGVARTSCTEHLQCPTSPGQRAALAFIADWANDCANDDTFYGFDEIERLARYLLAGLTNEAADTAPLDVERLARAMHDTLPHHERGGVDDALAKRSCVQFGWDKSRCVSRATALAAALTASARP